MNEPGTFRRRCPMRRLLLVALAASRPLLSAPAPSSGLAVGQFRVGDAAHLFRSDYVDDAKQLRVTHIVDAAHVHEDRVLSISLFSAGDMRFVWLLRKDRHAGQHVETIVSDKGQRVEFHRTANSDLTPKDHSRGAVGAGVLTIDGESMKITLATAGVATVPDRVAAMFSRWNLAEREGLNALYRETVPCPLHVGRGVALSALFFGPLPAGCQPGMLEASPDPERDVTFLAIVPELAEWLKRPSTRR